MKEVQTIAGLIDIFPLPARLAPPQKGQLTRCNFCCAIISLTDFSFQSNAEFYFVI